MQKNPFLEQLASSRRRGGPGRFQGRRGEDGQEGRAQPERRGRAKAIDPNSKDQARLIAQRIFGGKGNQGIATLFGRQGLGGSLQAAMGNMTGSTVGDAGGVLGMGLKGRRRRVAPGTPSASGGGHPRCGGGEGKCGTGIGMGQVERRHLDHSSDPEVTGAMDPELIRRVVRSHHDQLVLLRQRADPESQAHREGLGEVDHHRGRDGGLLQCVSSSTGTPELDRCIAGRVLTWIFPSRRAEGSPWSPIPFVFKQAGE